MSDLKITKAMNDGVARTNAVNALGLSNLVQVSNTEYAVLVKDAEGNDKVAVVKVTIPKAQVSLDTMAADYEDEKATKEAAKIEKANERAAAKAAKASTPKATRAKKATKEVSEDVEF